MPAKQKPGGLTSDPASPLFEAITLAQGRRAAQLKTGEMPESLRGLVEATQTGRRTLWGIPFRLGRVALASSAPVTLPLPAVLCRWLVLLHAAETVKDPPDGDGFVRPFRGMQPFGEHLADYVFVYADGEECRMPVRLRYEIGTTEKSWGERCVCAVADQAWRTMALGENARLTPANWGSFQTRVRGGEVTCGWLWAWENPRPEVPVHAVCIEPKTGAAILVAGLSAGQVSSNPLVWETRRKVLLTLPEEQEIDGARDRKGDWPQLRLDLGTVISMNPRPVYPNAQWEKGYATQLPDMHTREVIVEFACHPEARFHLWDGKTLAASSPKAAGISPVAPATQSVRIRVLDMKNRLPVPARLHIHGEAGEYLPPVDRHREPNILWYQDYSCDISRLAMHHSTYIDGEATVLLPLGTVYLEVTKGFEVRPVRQVAHINRATTEIVVELEHLLPWREKGWVTADTHVHFLSPQTALLEGAGEGVNVVNLLASQWGELMTNVGDFDGATHQLSLDGKPDGEYLVRVGSENRQNVMGHISLLGYDGRGLITPMTTGGPDESALGDPVGALLTEWAAECRRRGGVVVVPHFCWPRLENAAAIVSGNVDAVEMTSWGDLISGINPYALSDWYRYLNCGYLVAAAGGTDKMDAATAVGTIRTYVHLPQDQPFSYDAWKQAIRDARTFVTYGPLVDFRVEGRQPGSRIQLAATGGTLDIEWEVASLNLPMTRLDLMVNGEVRERRALKPDRDAGYLTTSIARSSWVALLIRGKYPDQPVEMIAAHTSPVMVEVENTPFYSEADALTILEQVEGSLAYLDAIGTRAGANEYKRLRLILTSVHRELHDRMHRQGVDHPHTAAQHHHR